MLRFAHIQPPRKILTFRRCRIDTIARKKQALVICQIVSNKDVLKVPVIYGTYQHRGEVRFFLISMED